MHYMHMHIQDMLVNSDAVLGVSSDERAPGGIGADPARSCAVHVREAWQIFREFI